MRKFSYAIAMGALALWLGGCGGDSAGGPTASAPSPSAAVPTAAQPATTVPSPATTTAQNLAQPSGAVSPSPTGTIPPDLISSTNPDQRLRLIQRSRPDPFALLATPPTIERSPAPQQESAPPPAPAPSVGAIPFSTPPNSSVPNSNPSSTAVAPALPPLPPPTTLARAVQVTGIVEVGGKVQAIVKAPNEPTSRYVQEGQYLSNGQVLVKRIEINRADPVVVFEQNGVEVPLAVGEGGSPANAPGTPGAPTAALPSTQVVASR